MVRPEEAGDRAAIHDLVIAAFGQSAEADLIDRLRANGDTVLSLVACEAQSPERALGHILFSRLAAPFRALTLAPLAVAPGRQRSGIGSRLVRDGLDLARAGGWQSVFVLGDPAFYRRFGFDAHLATRFRTPYDGPHLMALMLAGAAPSAAPIRWPKAFSALP
jgi:putative acetyltransferase